MNPYDICKWKMITMQYKFEEIIKEHKNLEECYYCSGKKQKCIEEKKFLSYEKTIREIVDFYFD